MSPRADVVDLFETVAQLRAAKARDSADACARAIYPILDRFRFDMANGDMADVMAIETVALLATNVALVAGQGVAGRTGCEAQALTRIRSAMDQLRSAIDAGQGAAERRVGRQLRDGVL